eukprot:scaffold34982_cov27-Tisochrysis_lutea.AAC.7
MFLKQLGRKPATPAGQSVSAALRSATPNTPAPLEPQALLYLMGSALREPPLLAMLWAERIVELGRQADATLKMLTVLHRLQIHSPAFTATLLGSSVHSKPFDTALGELSQRFGAVSAAGRGPFIRAYLAYLRLRMEAPIGGGCGGESAQSAKIGGGGGTLAMHAGLSLQRRMELEELMKQLPTWEALFDAALNAFELCKPSPLTHQVRMRPGPHLRREYHGGELLGLRGWRRSAGQGWAEACATEAL